MQNGNPSKPPTSRPPTSTLPKATAGDSTSAILPKQSASRHFETCQEPGTLLEERHMDKGSASTPTEATTILEATAEASVFTPDTSNRPRQARQKPPSVVGGDEELRTFMEQRLVTDGDPFIPPPLITASPEIRLPEASPETSKSTLKPSRPPRPWSPYNKAGLEDLRTLVSDLKKTATEFADFEDQWKEFQEEPSRGNKKVKLDREYSPIRNVARDRIIKFPEQDLVRHQLGGNRPSSDESGHTEHPQRLSDDLPESPVTRRLRVTKQPKRAPTEEEIQRLLYNPWAALLASPVRLCNATGVRLPASLLVPWELVRRPSDKDVYLMPRQLAVLDKLKQGRDGQEGHRGLWRFGSKGVTEPNCENGSDSRETPPKLDDPKRLGVLTRILPYQPLVQELTGRMTSHGKEVTRIGAVQRLLPQRAKNMMKTLKHYARESEEMLDPNGLLWQPDIAERMKGIMRVRVVTVLETLGELSGHGGCGSTAMIVPIETLSTAHISLHLERIREDARYSFFASQRLTEESNEDPYGDFEKGIIDAFGGSIILHVNAREPTNIPDQPRTVLSELAPNMLPQTICLENVLRIPVFDLKQLMGKPSRNSTARNCRKVMQTYAALHPPREEDGRPASLERDQTALVTDDKDIDSDPDVHESYLLLVTKRALGAHVLAKELWQLWRYAGGSMEAKSQDRDVLGTGKSNAELEGDAQDISQRHQDLKAL